MTRNSLLLSYDRPATDWEREALPIGNGRLGAMVLGEPHSARFQFNVDSLWTGDENPSGEFDDEGFGNYQAFGMLAIDLQDSKPVENYRRTLDLQHALHVTEWQGHDGTRYRQEAFASFPAEVIAVRLTAAGPSKLRGTVTLTGAHEERVDEAPDQLHFSAALGNGLRYAASVRVTASGGGVIAANGGKLRFDGADSLVLYLAAATNYRLDAEAGFRAAEPEPPLASSLASAQAKGFDRLRDEHVADYTGLFGRVGVDFGETASEVRAKPMDRRLAGQDVGRDPELAATLFQYGRYLLIASSRDNGLPANLQGIWNRVNNPPWHSDYHTNINIQMNYWLAGPTNLAELERPLFRLLDETLPAARSATKKAFGAETPGFTYRTSHNIFGGQGWQWNITANAWYALHYFEHYAFTGDRQFLSARAFPYLTEASEFWLHRLKRTAAGLVAPDGWSPEHGPREDGVSYDQELIWHLFEATLAAGTALGSELPLLGRVREAQAQLVMPKVGRWGQLQEWLEDRDDPTDQHRHTSHLIGVYPGTRISVSKTPELARAAEVSLRARGDNGDSRRSWTWPWRCALWARLGTRECHRMIDGYIAHNLLPNLIATHPPLQLDGSYGISAAIAEMLLQSHAAELSLLPGVEFTRWPRGAFRGLRARGGFEVSASWEAGRLLSAQVTARLAGPLVVRSTPAATRALDSTGSDQALERTATGAIRLMARAGETYRLSFD